jgi:hypothetical protein
MEPWPEVCGSVNCTSWNVLHVSLLLTDLQMHAPEYTGGVGPQTKQRTVEHV